jgi:Na+/H+ antiporter NhaD/arsenite permease-like protein
MSYREKSVWIALLLDLAIYGYYAWSLYEVIQAGQTETYEYFDRLIVLVVILVIATIILESIVAGSSPNEATAPADEREKLIALKATNVAYTITIIGALTAAGFIADNTFNRVPLFYIANGLFLAIVFAEIVRNATQIVCFRRGA